MDSCPWSPEARLRRLPTVLTIHCVQLQAVSENIFRKKHRASRPGAARPEEHYRGARGKLRLSDMSELAKSFRAGTQVAKHGNLRRSAGRMSTLADVTGKRSVNVVTESLHFLLPPITIQGKFTQWAVKCLLADPTKYPFQLSEPKERVVIA